MLTRNECFFLKSAINDRIHVLHTTRDRSRRMKDKAMVQDINAELEILYGILETFRERNLI